MCAQPVLMILVMSLLNFQRKVGVGLYWGTTGSQILLLGDIAHLALTSTHLEPSMSENILKLAGTSFETKDDYDFNVVNANAAVLNLWAAAHWWAADLCLVGRDKGWELRNCLDVSHVSQSVRSYQVLIVELEFPLHA